MEDTITIKQAYAAMYSYLQALYDTTGSDDLGGLLGSMSLLADGSPADPGVWEDWMRAVEQARNGQVNLTLGLSNSNE
jgi:hypothetical protein